MSRSNSNVGNRETIPVRQRLQFGNYQDLDMPHDTPRVTPRVTRASVASRTWDEGNNYNNKQRGDMQYYNTGHDSNSGVHGGRRLHLSKPGHIIDPIDSEEDINLNHEGQFGALNEMLGYDDEVELCKKKEIHKNVVISQIIVMLAGLVMSGPVQYYENLERINLKLCAIELNYFLHFNQVIYQFLKAVMWTTSFNKMISMKSSENLKPP